MTELEKAATEMLNCVDGMLAHGEWYAAQEKADNLRAILTWGEPVQAEPVISAIENGASFEVLEALAADFRKGLK